MKSWLRGKLAEDCACGSGASYSQCCLLKEAGYLLIAAGAGLTLFLCHSALPLLAIPVLLVSGVLAWLLRLHYGNRQTPAKTICLEASLPDKPQPTKVPNWLAAVILVVFCTFLLGFSQPVNMWRVKQWIANHEKEWSQFAAEHPQAKRVRFFADTRGNGTLGVLMEGVDEATTLKVEEFVSEHNPPRPVHYISTTPQ
jgi:hypothetical protein